MPTPIPTPMPMPMPVPIPTVPIPTPIKSAAAAAAVSGVVPLPLKARPERLPRRQASARPSLPPLPTHAYSRRPTHAHPVLGRSSRTPRAGGARAAPSKVAPLPSSRAQSAYPAGPASAPQPEPLGAARRWPGPAHAALTLKGNRAHATHRWRARRAFWRGPPAAKPRPERLPRAGPPLICLPTCLYLCRNLHLHLHLHLHLYLYLYLYL
eukprot:scaffold6624_cov62-Phaeocystis_antarctica.AAC.1